MYWHLRWLFVLPCLLCLLHTSPAPANENLPTARYWVRVKVNGSVIERSEVCADAIIFLQMLLKVQLDEADEADEETAIYGDCWQKAINRRLACQELEKTPTQLRKLKKEAAEEWEKHWTDKMKTLQERGITEADACQYLKSQGTTLESLQQLFVDTRLLLEFLWERTAHLDDYRQEPAIEKTPEQLRVNLRSNEPSEKEKRRIFINLRRQARIEVEFVKEKPRPLLEELKKAMNDK